ncbi:hypothetical protein acsn021_05040 [Anaerocolumna cellulosilytica]|uniref:Uncharacterized protein n=1 Tax=Anaerocolumna cellulosilytica TaxID=433286 RepID=A0A6S6QZZ6_9FIRM|nr:flagellar hook-associated protein FlgL [Anaerocolumna cellulosilytica]MBB5195729.1 flagellar hook-associated protein 3 FlgL [Anaerocolumna cellulosilytica]BCJ92935.1 hypothetical protein acsn021_05040 [Anaerocolumna cellulosilytica]
MRITNKMMTNNMMSNINNNKNNLSILDSQYATGKKIQRPSQDPIVAVRALKLRTNLRELNQYLEKNIPDAMSWMEVTESALKNVNEMFTKINTLCNQGANDHLEAPDRASIAETLTELKKQIYQEGNSNYAGRYVLTGYKTDTSLIFNEKTTNLTYKITEQFSGKNIESLSKVSGAYDVDSTVAVTDPSPQLDNMHRIRLSYDNLVTPTGAINVTYGTGPTTVAVNTISATNPNAYKPAPGAINFIPETGELILGDTVYGNMKNADNISITYDKKEFKEGELRPEHYFKCETVDSDTGKTTVYEPTDQQIQYEVNFNQKLTVNTQGKDALQHGVGRDIDEILSAVKDVEAVEAKITEIEKQLKDPTKTEAEIQNLNRLLEHCKTELTLKSSIMQKKFEGGIASSKKYQETLNVSIADLGSRYVRLELTESRLSDQQVEFEDLLSANEDVDMVETYIKLTSQEAIYTASLNAASKVVRSSLLDFL